MFALIFFAAPIIIADCRYRIIPNIYITFIFYWIALVRIVDPIASIKILVVTTALSVAATIFLKMGSGDAKLIILTSLALNFATFSHLLQLIASIYLSAVLQVGMCWLYKGRVPPSIPMAFSIFAGTFLYLATPESAYLREYAHALVNSW